MAANNSDLAVAKFLADLNELNEPLSAQCLHQSTLLLGCCLWSPAGVWWRSAVHICGTQVATNGTPPVLIRWRAIFEGQTNGLDLPQLGTTVSKLSTYLTEARASGKQDRNRLIETSQEIRVQNLNRQVVVDLWL